MIFTLWAAYRSYLFLQPRADSIIGWILTWGKSRRVLSDITTAVLDPRQPETGALTIVAVMLALFATGLLALGQYFGDHHLFIHIDKAVFTLLQELRTPWADKIMVTLMGLGDAAVLLFLGLAVLAWLAWRRYWITAVHWLAALAFAMVLSFVVGREPTPWTVEDITRQALETLWTNGHVTQATVIYGFFAVFPDIDRDDIGVVLDHDSGHSLSPPCLQTAYSGRNAKCRRDRIADRLCVVYRRTSGTGAETLYAAPSPAFY